MRQHNKDVKVRCVVRLLGLDFNFIVYFSSCDFGVVYLVCLSFVPLHQGELLVIPTSTGLRDQMRLYRGLRKLLRCLENLQDRESKAANLCGRYRVLDMTEVD